ncbi:unnamed protein product [Prorocentrum cordatum]|uniref:Uncharacterized protein n=1 Tax=Prorocentrum cordatum TaxID=2364126 RepID=A0ABN9UI47_9DINO|nr:unnamed protein product [Polarella glacialis]
MPPTRRSPTPRRRGPESAEGIARAPLFQTEPGGSRAATDVQRGPARPPGPRGSAPFRDRVPGCFQLLANFTLPSFTPQLLSFTGSFAGPWFLFAMFFCVSSSRFCISRDVPAFCTFWLPKAIRKMPKHPCINAIAKLASSSCCSFSPTSSSSMSAQATAAFLVSWMVAQSSGRGL